jgi:hypothetical protein
MPLAGFEFATPATKWPQTYALDRADTGIDNLFCRSTKMLNGNDILNCLVSEQLHSN